eukprot:2730764-Alexandrium_andersonii.AAC.1
MSAPAAHRPGKPTLQVTMGGRRESQLRTHALPRDPLRHPVTTLKTGPRSSRGPERCTPCRLCSRKYRLC